jgi:hypothetical protein
MKKKTNDDILNIIVIGTDIDLFYWGEWQLYGIALFRNPEKKILLQIIT